MSGFRKERLEREMLRRVSEIVTYEIKDPRVGSATVTRVELSNDFSVAKVFVSVMADEKTRDETIAALNAAATFVRGRLREEIRLRTHPEVRFVLDKGLENVLQVEEILNRLKKEKDEGKR